jgi:phosphoglucosamine mutase
MNDDLQEGAPVVRKLFGTDGIRGIANEHLSAELALAVGRAAVAILPPEAPRIIIGRDTRISGPMLEAALVAGISSAGGQAELAGVIPTPAVASLVLSQNADAGAVISASHNPYKDNGIKFFGPDGFKLTDDQEANIESYLFHELTSTSGSPEPGPVCDFLNPAEIYLESLLSRFNLTLSGLRVMVDCANGAAYKTAPEALARLGADVTVIAGDPDGYNINSGCGSTHIGELQAQVTAGSFDVGLAFDGDGDRVIAVDASGDAVDGDFIMAICAGYLKDQGRLPGDTIVTTVMTNLGFHQAMAKAGIAVKTTDVGDRYVLEEMIAGGYTFGGEQSGHIINLEAGTTGDGLATSLLLLGLMSTTGTPLGELTKVMQRLPQKLVNVKVPDRDALGHADAVWTAVRRQEELLAGEGRILVRPSGTEPLVRVMVEAPTVTQCDTVCDNIVAVIEHSLK